MREDQIPLDNELATGSLISGNIPVAYPCFAEGTTYGSVPIVFRKENKILVVFSNGDIQPILPDKDSWAGEWIFSSELIAESICTAEIENAVAIYSISEQITQIQRSMGLNILEMAAVMKVSRPTIYKWVKSKNASIRKPHQERLDQLYEIQENWGSKNLGRIGSYLHRPIGNEKLTLFGLLKKDILNQEKIAHYLRNIAQCIISKRQEDAARESLLKKHGFEPISEEDREDRINDIDFLDE